MLAGHLSKPSTPTCTSCCRIPSCCSTASCFMRITRHNTFWKFLGSAAERAPGSRNRCSRAASCCCVQLKPRCARLEAVMLMSAAARCLRRWGSNSMPARVSRSAVDSSCSCCCPCLPWRQCCRPLGLFRVAAAHRMFVMPVETVGSRSTCRGAGKWGNSNVTVHQVCVPVTHLRPVTSKQGSQPTAK